MKEQDKTLKQALQKAANEGAIAEDPSVEITPSAELDKKMNAFSIPSKAEMPNRPNSSIHRQIRNCRK